MLNIDSRYFPYFLFKSPIHQKSLLSVLKAKNRLKAFKKSINQLQSYCQLTQIHVRFTEHTTP